MQIRIFNRLVAFIALGAASFDAPITKAQDRVVQMANDPALSPDGNTLAFTWANEVWTVPIDGGIAKRMTNNSARDAQPKYSYDGKSIAFTSNRTGSDQIYVMPADGGLPVQKTYHTEGYDIAGWFPDGKRLLAIGQRDHFWRGASRLMEVNLENRIADKVLLDDTAADAMLSPDGKKVLFVREGERWWRKGYFGERAAQIWHLDLETKQVKELLHESYESRWPVWTADGNGFYFAKGSPHGYDLWQYRFSESEELPVKKEKTTSFDDDSIVKLAISHDGSRIVFRHLFDLYSYGPGTGKEPKKIDIRVAADAQLPEDNQRDVISRADRVAFSDDGLDIAFTAGGDLWVMDTELREPIQVAKTDGTESDPIFTNDGKSLWFTRATDGQVDVWKVEPKNKDVYWWQQKEFIETQMTKTPRVESNLAFTPNGKHLLFQSGRGDLMQMKLDDQSTSVLVDGFSRVSYSISPDSKWIAYESQDPDFNSDIWLMPIDQSSKPVNVSRHPDNDGNPVFSPDGKLLAFTGRRYDTEVDVYYVYLQESNDEKTSRDRKMEKALEAMKKKRISDPKQAALEKKDGASPEEKGTKESGEEKSAEAADGKKSSKDKEKEDFEKNPIKIDVDRIHERVRRISLPDTSEGNLLFSPDSKKLAFSASVDGKPGWYSVEFPDKLQPKLLSSTVVSNAKWTKAAAGLLGLNRGTPVKLENGEKSVEYPFSVRHERSRSGRMRDGFFAAWQSMFDIWYDPRMGGKNWDSIQRKYANAAANTHDERGLAEVVELMLGELNGSHLGFTPSISETSEDAPPSNSSKWSKTTAHLGVRFDETFQGPGLRVRDVIKDGPADLKESSLLAGDIIVTIDEQKVDPGMDLTTILNGTLDRDIQLLVERKNQQEAKTDELRIRLRPTTYARARSLLYDHWLEGNRSIVDKLSNGKLGYLHIRAMDMSSFYEFEQQLYNVGYGRDGLVIDVRDNGGGSTTDLLLTALTQPRHAITIPRGGNEGYPHDRMVYATWTKPIVVLCNQNSYSNAEIFSHAIKALKRGKLIGVQTAGGVVSTGVAKVTDVGVLRAPFRGWFSIETGKDMELNGAIPDIVVWPKPGEIPLGIDHQLEQAVKTLQEEVAKVPPAPKPKYATEEGRKP